MAVCSLHARALLLVEPARLEQDAVGDADLADVVHGAGVRRVSVLGAHPGGRGRGAGRGALMRLRCARRCRRRAARPPGRGA